MGPATKATAERLAAAIREFNAGGKHDKLVARALAGEFADYADPPPGADWICQITELHRLCVKYGLHDLAARVANGEFDASKDESDEWARSQSGREVARALSPAMRSVFGLPDPNTH